MIDTRLAAAAEILFLSVARDRDDDGGFGQFPAKTTGDFWNGRSGGCGFSANPSGGPLKGLGTF